MEDYGIDVNKRYGPKDNTALHIAASVGSDKHLATCKVLTDILRADVHAKNSEGCTPLHQAGSSENDAHEITAFLLKCGAKVNTVCN